MSLSMHVPQPPHPNPGRPTIPPEIPPENPPEIPPDGPPDTPPGEPPITPPHEPPTDPPREPPTQPPQNPETDEPEVDLPPAESPIRHQVSQDGISTALRVNGVSHALTLDPRATLLDTLRESFHLTGTKKGCDHGQCGACTVHVDGRRVNACLVLAVTLHDRDVTTIEGLGSAESLHPLQVAFVEHDGYQCGYCTAGQIMSAAALLHEPCGDSDGEVRELMSGNICRCGAYANIVAAIQDVRKKG